MTHGWWEYTTEKRYKISAEKFINLRTNLINHTKQQRISQIAKVNFVRIWLHPDIIPLIVNLIHDLLPIHYLETCLC